MIRRSEQRLLFLHLVLDVALTLCAMRLADALRHHFLLGIEQRQGNFILPTLVYIVAAAVWGIMFQLLPIFDSKRTTTLWQEWAGLFKAVAICMLAMASLFYWLNIPPSRLFFLYFWLFDLGTLMGFHALVRHVQQIARAHGYDQRRVVVVGSGPVAHAVLDRIATHAWSGLSLVGVVNDDVVLDYVRDIPVLGRIADLPRLLAPAKADEAIDEVIIALPSSAHELVAHLSNELQRYPVVVKVAPDLLDIFLLSSSITDLWGLPLLSVREPAITGMRWFFKRALDLCITSVLLIVTAPLLVLIALAIYLESGGPVLLRQERVGEHGRVFPMYKFRTMYPDRGRSDGQAAPLDATALDATAIKRRDDPRITRLGGYLRRASLDELPQLFNVLRGQMSLVGPRPELPRIVALYEPWQHVRHVVPPGMTGWWQINGRSEEPLHLNTQFDLFYIQKYSVLLDLRILARTIGVVIRGRGAF